MQTQSTKKKRAAKRSKAQMIIDTLPPETITYKRVNQKIDKAKLVELRVDNRLSVNELAKYFNCSKDAVSEALKRLGLKASDYSVLDQFTKCPDKFAEVRQFQTLVALTPDKLNDSNAYQLATVFGILSDKISAMRKKTNELSDFINLVNNLNLQLNITSNNVNSLANMSSRESRQIPDNKEDSEILANMTNDEGKKCP